MVNKATVAFAFSVVGAAYQMISPYAAALANGNNLSYLYTYGLETLILSSFIVFWGAIHLVEDWKGRITWSIPNIRPRRCKFCRYHNGILYPLKHIGDLHY